METWSRSSRLRPNNQLSRGKGAIMTRDMALDRTVKQPGRAVLALDCMPAGAESRCPAAGPNR